MVRLAGARACHLARQLFRPFSTDTAFPQPLKATAGTAVRDAAGAPLDRGVLVFFPAAISPVGEDLVEVTLHGNPVILSLYLEACVRQGARLALPGEFSYRAFLNDRLDAAQAEAVDDLIKARTEYQVRVAHEQQSGALAKALEPVRRRLVRDLARQEASIEFSSSEAQEFFSRTAFLESLAESRGQILALLRSARAGLALAKGCRVVLAGPVNAGKSSLFNRLLGTDRAIVHAGPGTTRDLVEGQVEWDGLPLTLVDTAGSRLETVASGSSGLPVEAGAGETVADEVETDAVHPVEAEGLRRGRQAQRQADLVLWVRDVTEPGGGPPPEGSVAFLQVTNKIDLLSPGDAACRAPGADELAVSATTGAGVKTLKARIMALLVPGWQRDDPPLVSRLRQKRGLEQVEACLQEAAGLAREGTGEEILVLPLERALDHLFSLTGRGDREEMYEQIFSTFCIGK